MFQGVDRFPPQGDEVGAFDPVTAGELLHHEFGIGKDPEFLHLYLPGLGEAQEQGLIFRHIIGGFSQVAALVGLEPALGVKKHHPGAGGAGIAPGGPVAAEEPDPLPPVPVQFGGFSEQFLQGLRRQAKALSQPREVQSLGQRRKDGSSLVQTAPLTAQRADWFEVLASSISSAQ